MHMCVDVVASLGMSVEMFRGKGWQGQGQGAGNSFHLCEVGQRPREAGTETGGREDLKWQPQSYLFSLSVVLIPFFSHGLGCTLCHVLMA